MRRAVTPAIPPSMYRHFAIITLVLTTALAMFADGESRQTQTVHAGTPAARPAAPAALAIAANADAGGWGAEAGSDGSFGNPMEQLISGASSVIPDLDEIVAPGYSPDYLASLSEEERELLLQGLQENGMLEPEIHSQRSAALSAASSRRSRASS